MATLITESGLKKQIHPIGAKVSMVEIRDAVGAYHIGFIQVGEDVFCYDAHAEDRNLEKNPIASALSKRNMLGKVVIINKNQIENEEQH